MTSKLRGVASNETRDARTKPRTVFISHSLEDRPIAERLRAALESVGMEAEDPVSAVAPGDNILAAISAAIERADVVVVLVSPRSKGSARSKGSDWVETEAAIAVGRVLTGRGGRVIPVILGHAKLPFLLKEFQAIQIEEPAMLEGIADSIARLTAETITGDDELRRSAELQRHSLDHEKLQYEGERRVLEAQQQRFAVALSIALTAVVALLSIAAIIFWKSDLLTVLLSPVAALLSATGAFHYGRRPLRGVAEQHERSQS